MSYVILRVFNLKDLETLKKNKDLLFENPVPATIFSALLQKKTHTQKLDSFSTFFSFLLFKKSLFKKDYSPMIKGFWESRKWV